METLIVQSGLKRHQEKRYLMGFQFFEGDFQKYFVEHEQQAIKSEKKITPHNLPGTKSPHTQNLPGTKSPRT